MRLNEIEQDVEQYKLPSQYKKLVDIHKNNKTVLYRGIKSDALYIVQDGSLMNRISSDDESPNILNRLTEVLPSWKGWPARTKSFCCTNKYVVAKSYADTKGTSGSVYLSIPLENQPLAVAPTTDFWNSTDHFSKTLIDSVGMSYFMIDSHLNKMLHAASEVYNLPKLNKMDSSAKVVQALQSLDQALKEDESSTIGVYLNIPTYKANSSMSKMYYTLKRCDNIMELLNDGFDPKKNGCELYQTMDKIPYFSVGPFGQGREIWFTGKGLFVRLNDRGQV